MQNTVKTLKNNCKSLGQYDSKSSRWREIRACNDNACGESKGQNSHESLLDLTFLIAAPDPKAPMD